MSDENMCRKDCRSRNCSAPNHRRQHNKLLHFDFSRKEDTTGTSQATTTVATNISQGLPGSAHKTGD